MLHGFHGTLRGRRYWVLFVAAIPLAVSACDGAEPEAVAAVVPSVKYEIVAQRSTGQLREISGKVAAAEVTMLSFAVAGTVLSVDVGLGDAVVRGQVLARLDDASFALTVRSAQSKVNAASARYAEAAEELSRKQILFDKDLVAQAALDKATASAEAARSDVSVARDNKALAQRDLDRTVLTAPFDGTIAMRDVEPFVEVSVGQSLVEIQTEGAMVVDVLVPETIIREVDFGQAVVVRFPTLADREMGGTVSEIASQTGAGNAFAVEIQLGGQDVDLRPGMTATVQFNFDRYLAGKERFLIPLSAISLKEGAVESSAGDDAGGGQGRSTPIFVYDEGAGVVRLRRVGIGEARGTRVEVNDGLEAGEKIITAGVSFLHDGMKVQLWTAGGQ